MAIVALDHDTQLSPAAIAIHFDVGADLSIDLALNCLQDFRQERPVIVFCRHGNGQILFLFAFYVNFAKELCTKEIDLCLQIFVQVLLSHSLQLRIIDLCSSGHTIITNDGIECNFFFFRFSGAGAAAITAAGGEQNKCHGRRQNQSGQFFQHFHVGTSSRFVVFFIICRVPFHFEAGPLLTLFYPTTVAFVNCQLHQTFSPAFVVFSRTNLRKDPLPHPGQKPENISGVYTILPRFGAKLKAMGTAGCRS